MVRVVRASGHGEVASEGVHGMPLGLLLRLGVQPGELERAQGVLQGAAEGLVQRKEDDRVVVSHSCVDFRRPQ